MSPVAYTATHNVPTLHPTPEQKKRAAAVAAAMGNTDVAVQKGAKEVPSSQAALEDLTRRVRNQSDRLQQALAPTAETVKTFAEARPVIFTFLAIFAALSLIPTLCAVGFILATGAVFMGVATVLLFFSIAGVVCLTLVFLVPTLIVTAALSLGAVSFLLALFLAHRLYLHLSSAYTHAGSVLSMSVISEGAAGWIEETLARVGLGSADSGPVFEDHRAARSIDAGQDYQLAKPHNVHGDYAAFANARREREWEEAWEREKNGSASGPPSVKVEQLDVFSGPRQISHSRVKTEEDEGDWISEGE